MEITFEQLREKEVINICTGKKLGRVIDIVFDLRNASLKGLVVPGDKKLFKKSDDIFIAIRQIRRIGDDVILVAINDTQKLEERLSSENKISFNQFEKPRKLSLNGRISSDKGSFARYRRIRSNKYK